MTPVQTVTVPRLFTEVEVAELTGVPVRTLQSWRFEERAGTPPYVRLGRSVRYPADRLVAWIESQVVVH